MTLATTDPYSLHGSASEENDALEPLVVKKIIEAPETADFAEGVRRQVGVVWVNVAIFEGDLVVDRDPQRRPQAAVLIAGRGDQVRVYGVLHPLARRLLAELVALKKNLNEWMR